MPIGAGARWLLPVTPSQARGDERRSGGKPPKSLSPSNVELPACLEGFPKQAENLHGMVFRSFPARAGEIGDQIGAIRGIGQARDGKRVVWGKSGSVRVSIGGRRILKKKIQDKQHDKSR